LEETYRSPVEVAIRAIKRGLVCVVFVNDIQIWERKADEFFGETDVVAQANGRAKMCSAALLAAGLNTRVTYIKD